MKAFPMAHPSENTRFLDSGMDLRDYFAAKAMQGLVSNGAYDQSNLTGLSNYAYVLADFMMGKRNATK